MERRFKKDNLEEAVLDLRRVTRVMAGGKRMRFRATMVVGDLKGKVGVGVAKGLDVEQAITKARSKAQKNMIEVKMKDKSIPHEVWAKFGAAEVLIKPAVPGHGLVAGGSPRIVLKLAGIQDVTAKCLGTTKNKLNFAISTINALNKLKPAKN
ncbi:MAG: 30S ribosomal protein S5 [Candidatus Colwellbacteria bacterium RIFCSPHIGHO2_12_FULL_43_12]|uniref:Small ribosomal subunit protein uS5 n=3 Tax=Candidatus Colwelliibacteriota TaxID=1817904 RepID=A0A1G1YZQ5_9BACT|nr:MAG: 30S ribosomal protein S5 [Candidatus Colwellbacteria bacterium RIFCSPHIGHO2_02_FULL_43_15]OGY58348.1 MAG: 30S ribosomal protein S5 [Candidatus Colwellbacteria bacterium RIFCSPHIGHO2_12_FULL_43_12]OGY60718.1 MAG: 30S ribosomal protein S5 [Candidatus Colwellbacteria bacterium RIFCSPLOWO2_12_FULL_43_11]